LQQLRGWGPVFAGMTCMALSAGMIGIYGFFVEHLSKEFGVGVATINLGPVALLLVPGLIGPLVGKLVDRVPIRRIMLAGSFIAMTALCLASAAPVLWLAALGFVGFSLGLSMYGPVVVGGLLIKLYPGREAKVLAFAAMGISFATALLPPITGFLLAHLGWREALASLAVSILVVVWLVIWAGIPADAGVMPKSDESDAEQVNIYSHASFWLVGFSVAMAFNAAIVLAICYPPHFTNRGFSVTEAGMFLALSGVAGLGGKFMIVIFSGFVSKYTKAVAACLLLGQAGGMILLLGAQTIAQTLPIMVLMGICSGGFLPMHPFLNSRYFKAEVIGQVNGAQMPLFLPFGLVGAPLAGYMFDRQGNYELVLMGLAGVLICAAILTLLLPKVTVAPPSA
jgi:predicted MFS family arabinose efflux permease